MRWTVRQAARILLHGGIVAYPTEAVYGLGCNPLDLQAVMRVLQIKQRDISQGLILVSDSLHRLSPFIRELSTADKGRVSETWPGPVTWLVPAADDCPLWLRGDHTTIAIRVTAHSQTRELCAEAGMALVSTSANRSGQAPARSTYQVRRELGREVDFILGGATDGYARPSQIRDLVSGRIVRQ